MPTLLLYLAQVIYELSSVEDHIEPRLRLRVESHDQQEDTRPALPTGISAKDGTLNIGDDPTLSVTEDDAGGISRDDTDVSVLVSPEVAESTGSAHVQ